jgi:phosphate/sulfate permease
MINNNNSRSIGLIIFHVCCLIAYLVCISLSIYGYYAFFSSLTVSNIVNTALNKATLDYTWLIVAIILDVFALALSITQCCVGCICGCMYMKNRNVQPIIVTPTVAVNTVPTTYNQHYNRPPVNTEDNQLKIEMQQYY